MLFIIYCLFLIIGMTTVLADGKKGPFLNHMNELKKRMYLSTAKSMSHSRITTKEEIPSIANYTSYMHIYTVDGNNPENNWNASIVEYFLKYPNGNSLARDDNFYIAFANGINAEDMVQFNYCYANEDLQDSYVITYPVQASSQTCSHSTEPNYDQGCVSYFENLPISTKSEEDCISPYSQEAGDSWEVNFPGIVYLQYCLRKGESATAPVPLFFKSIIDNVTMLVVFALYSDHPAPERVFQLPKYVINRVIRNFSV